VSGRRKSLHYNIIFNYNVLLFIIQQVSEMILRRSVRPAWCHGALVPADRSSRQNLVEIRYCFPIVFAWRTEFATNGKRTILLKSMRSNNNCEIRKEEDITSFTSFSFTMRILCYIYHIFIYIDYNSY